MSLVVLLVFVGVALAVSPTARAKAMDASRHVPGLVDAAKRAVQRVSAAPSQIQPQSAADIPEPSGPDRDPEPRSPPQFIGGSSP
jgi:hypothetical protein